MFEPITFGFHVGGYKSRTMPDPIVQYGRILDSCGGLPGRIFCQGTNKRIQIGVKDLLGYGRLTIFRAAQFWVAVKGKSPARLQWIDTIALINLDTFELHSN